MASFSVSLPAEPASLLRLRNELQRWLEQTGVPTDLAFGVVAAASEAASNAVEHAEGPREPVVELEAEYHQDLLTVRVRDHGRWREPRFDSGRNRGLLLISGLMSEVDIDRSGKGTVVTMRLALGPA